MLYCKGELYKVASVIKKINSNAILVEDNGIEKILMGKGIGFQTDLNKDFDVECADKIFVLDSKEKSNRFMQFAAQTPLEYIEFAERMIEFIANEINQELDPYINIALTEHIYFAVQRQKDDPQVTAIMLPEMKMMYPKEFQVASVVVDKINQEFSTEFRDNEVGFVTMHIVNAVLGERDSQNSLKMLEIMSNILDLIETKHHLTFDTDSFHYNRLLIHLRFLCKRIVYLENLSDEKFAFLDKQFRETYCYQIAKDIAEMIKEKYKIVISNSEIDYLAIHLNRIH